MIDASRRLVLQAKCNLSSFNGEKARQAGGEGWAGRVHDRVDPLATEANQRVLVCLAR